MDWLLLLSGIFWIAVGFSLVKRAKEDRCLILGASSTICLFFGLLPYFVFLRRSVARMHIIAFPDFLLFALGAVVILLASMWLGSRLQSIIRHIFGTGTFGGRSIINI